MTQNTNSNHPQPPLTVSETAAEALKTAANNANINMDETVVRVSVQQHEDGLAHHIALESGAAERDVVFEQHGITVVVDQDQVPALAGAHFDYADAGGEPQLVVSNPNITPG